MEIHEIQASDLPPLLFTSRREYDSSHLKSVKNLKYRNKPGGGLWTSPINETGESHWSSWCANEGLDVLTHRYRVVISDEARVLVIDSLDDLYTASQSYPYYEAMEPEYEPYYEFLKHKSTPIDWEALANEFDAIWLTPGGLQTACQFTFDRPKLSLYSWDVESVFILNTDLINSVSRW